MSNLTVRRSNKSRHFCGNFAICVVFKFDNNASWLTILFKTPLYTDEFFFTYSLIGCVAKWLLRLIAYKLCSVDDAKFTVSNKL